MTNKTFKCPKCQHPNYSDDAPYELDGKPLRYCNGSTCTFAWSHLNDHLYLKDAKPEIVRCPIKLSESGDFLIAELRGEKKSLHLMIGRPGFSGFEFEDGSVSLESPWAWKHKDSGKLARVYPCTGSAMMADYTPVLAKFVRVRSAS